MQTHNAIVDVEVCHWDAPQSVGARDLDLRPKAHQRRRRIAREGRPASLTARSNMAQVAILLQAKSATLAPQQRLVVPEAARIETDIAAQRAHVPQYRRRNRLRRMVQHRIFSPDEWRVFDGSQRCRSEEHTSELQSL